MNLKAKIKIYKKVVEEICKKYGDGRKFIDNKVNELCFQEGISTEEVRLYIFQIKRRETYSVLEYLFLCFVILRTQFSYVHSLERIYFHYLLTLKQFCFEM